MHTNFTVQRQNITDQDVFIYDISLLPITGIEELEDAIIFYAEGENDTLECQAFLSGANIVFEQTVVPPTNWNALWESNFDAVEIENYLHIRADFHPSKKDTFKHEIIINPKMSFGTGHHATTQQVIILMQQLNFVGASVLDFGTGTGVLAIHASQLGATQIDACDNDQWCIDNSLENLATNKISNINIFNANVPTPNKTYNIVLANVNRHILLNNGIALTNAVMPSGFLIISGILNSDIDELTNYFEGHSFKSVKAITKNNWAAILFSK